jgi:AbrB family looped-hinge helix DNA binding protein
MHRQEGRAIPSVGGSAQRLGKREGYCHNDGMAIVTLDEDGRLIVPKRVREEAGILPGAPLRIFCRDGRIEIEPLAREVEAVDQEGFRVAEPLAGSEPLTRKAVKRVREELRGERGRQ